MEINELLQWLQAEKQLQEMVARNNKGDDAFALGKLDLLNHLIHHLNNGTLPPRII